MARYQLELLDLEDINMLSCVEATSADMLILEIENGSMFFMNEEQALQLAHHLQRWAGRNERGDSDE